VTTARHFAASLKAVSDAGPGSWSAVASTPSVDRDDEVLEPGCFDPLPAQVPVHATHSGPIIGSGRPYYVGNALHIDGKFASTPEAQAVRTLVTEGHLQTMSVAFMPLKDQRKAGRRHVTKGELLAVDWASIPSNRDALVLAAKAAKAGARNSAADQARLQSAHDDLVASGAMCADPDGDVTAIAQALDAALDEVAGALESNDVTWATALLTAASAIADALLAQLGAPDADDLAEPIKDMSRRRSTADDELWLRAKRLYFEATLALTKATAADEAPTHMERAIADARARRDVEREAAERVAFAMKRSAENPVQITHGYGYQTLDRQPLMVVNADPDPRPDRAEALQSDLQTPQYERAEPRPAPPVPYWMGGPGTPEPS